MRRRRRGSDREAARPVPGTVFTLGDNVQDAGADAEYANCFEPTWGRHRSRMLPTVGNHDWFGGHGRPYFSYFGASAGPAGLGYYSQTVGAWHVISLNNDIASGPGTTQYDWLKTELALSAADCTLAMWPRPFFTSGPNGGAPTACLIRRLCKPPSPVHLVGRRSDRHAHNASQI